MKKKKKLSAAQKAALAKGRKVLKYIRQGRNVQPSKEPIVIKEGLLMGAAKKKSKKRLYGFEGFEGGKRKSKRVKHVVYGFEGARKKRSRKSGSTLHGASKGFDLLGILTDFAGLVGGGVAGSFAAGLVPQIKNPYIKALVPAAVGATLVSMPKVSKIRFFNRVGLGSLAISGVLIAKNLMPKVPLLSGADDAEGIGRAIENLPAEEKAILGLLPEPEETAGETETTEGAGEEEYTGTSEPGEMLGATSYNGSEPGEMLGETALVGFGMDGEDDFS